MESSISMHFISISHYKKLRMIASRPYSFFPSWKTVEIPKKPNILTDSPAKGSRGIRFASEDVAAFDAKLRQCTQGSDTASAIGGHNQPGFHEPRWAKMDGPWVRDPVKLRGSETRWRFASKILFHSQKVWEKTKSNGQWESVLSHFLGGRLPTFRGGLLARNVTKWLPIWQHNTSVMCN